MEHKTTDQLLDILHHISDRRKYRLTCGLSRGADYAAENKLESECLYELSQRGVSDSCIADCYPVIRMVII